MRKWHTRETADEALEDPSPSGLFMTGATPEIPSGASAPRRRWGQELTPGSLNRPNCYRAPEDGFVLCTIRNPPDGTKGSVCWGYLRVTSTGVDTHAWVTGGNLGYYGPSRSSTSNPNSFIVPVFRYYYFYCGVQEATTGQQADAPYRFWWLSTSGADIYQQDFIQVDKSSDPDFMPPLLPQAAGEGTQDRRKFIAILERLLDKPIDARTQQELLALGPVG